MTTDMFPLVVNTSQSSPHSWLIIGFVTRLTWCVTSGAGTAYPEHQSSPPVFSGVRVSRSLVLYVCFVDRCLYLCTFSFGHCVVCSSIYAYTDSDCPFGIFKLFLWQILVYSKFIFNVGLHINLQVHV